jgi:hypothetical protein
VKNKWSFTSIPPVCIHGVEMNSVSISLLVMMIDVRLCTVCQFSVKFSYTFLGTVKVSNHTNICFTY